MSTGLTDAAATSTRISPGPGSTTGTSNDQPDARPGGVEEDLAHAVEALVERAHAREDVVARHGQRGDAGEHRRDDLVDAAADREEPFHVAGEDVGERQEPDRLSGGRAVDDHDVPLARLCERLDVGEGEDLVESGDHRQLFGLEPVDARPAEDLAQVALDLVPALLHPLLRVELLPPQVVGHGRGQRPQGHVERIGQGVGRIGGDDDRAKARIGTPHGGGRGGRGLADAALPGEEEDPRHRASTCARSSRSAVWMIFCSARRFTNVGSGMMRSTARWYVTRVRPSVPPGVSS